MMASEVVYKQEFNIRNVATRSVTLYPARAQVVRDIRDISLKPGANEITIIGLTPTVDENSIKVDGKGSATITDMTVELISNTERFEDIHPSDSDDDGTDDADDDPSDPENDQLRALTEKAIELDKALARAREEQHAGAAQMLIVQHYADSMARARPDDLGQFMSSHRIERKKAYDIVFESDNRIKALERQQHRNQRELAKLKKCLKKAGLKALKERAKELKKKQRAREEKKAAKRRLKVERSQFWPRKVYRVIVSLDTHSSPTPASSRRGSIDTIGKPVSEDLLSEDCNIALSISYITSSACWSPRYDVALDTTKSTGLITYRAEFCNTTSETWQDAKVVLSTSQTAFQGLGEPIPILSPWHVRLRKKTAGNNDSTSGALLSSHESTYKHQIDSNPKQTSVMRSTLFGTGSEHAPVRKAMFPDYNAYQPQALSQPSMAYQHAQQRHIQQQQMLAQMQQQQIAAAQQQQQMQAQQQQVQQRAMAASQAPQASRQRAQPYTGYHNDDAEGEVDDVDNEDDELEVGGSEYETLIPELPALATQESTWSESGLTATYDIPGLRTISPSNTTRRQKIASIHLKDINLSYLMVPKLRAAAFLKARLHNTSSITLLRGPCGLTLDGSFLGNTTLPRCSAGDIFRLSLGVDPSVSVVYSKPVVRRSQSGMFGKEGSGIYTRTCTVTNTKANRVLEGTFMDQIPVSEDERLRVEILQPAGLRSEGATAASGVGLPAAGKVTEQWGKANATLKKDGEVWWDLKIEPGRGVKLVLEYEARFPTTDIVVGV
ncbi:hypothetical protein G7Y79_00059g091900 [Physcia stellaris]|nr:hypothetical protein G7Y79_00059g091900 [Physcia stellaris]